MTFARIFTITLLAALPLSAAIRERATATLPSVKISGIIRDAATGAPVPGAIVRSGTNTSVQNGNGTKIDGKYSIVLPAGRPALLTVSDFAYQPFTVTVTPEANMILDLALPQANPAVTVKLVNGESHVLDLGTSQFGYYIVLSGYARFDNANLDSSPTEAVLLGDIAKIVGPATSVNFSPCCTRGPVLTLNVELKSGQKSQMYLVDSCYDNELDFIGRERSTAQWMYLNLNNIAEIDFP